MTVFSMTGFGRAESSGDRLAITVEIKTVNNRFKDYRFKMGSALSSLEFELRGQLEKEFKRGTFDINVTYQRKTDAPSEFQIDEAKVKDFLKLVKQYVGDNVSLQASPVDFLRSDFAREDEQSKSAELSSLVKTSFAQAVEELKKSRAAEGKSLVAKLLEHLSAYETLLKRNEELKSIYPEMIKEKLTSKLNERLKEFKVDEGRTMQEIIFYLERLEVDEEINRAKIHLAKLREVLKGGGEVGRQIDFLLQELGRETNTLGAKSAHVEISQNVVEMKVQLEKIREQALNLE